MWRRVCPLLAAVVMAAMPAVAVARPHTVMLRQKWRRATAGDVSYVEAAGPWVFIGEPFSPAGDVGIAVDEQTGERLPIALPSGCSAGAQLGDARLLFSCSGGVTIDSLTTGVLTPVALNPQLASYQSNCQSINLSDTEYECDVSPVAVGGDWVQFDESCSGHCLFDGTPPDTYEFENIESHALTPNPTGGKTYADLNSAGLARSLCAPLRIPELPDAYTDPSGVSHAGPGSVTLEGPFAIVGAGPTGETYYLERCGSRLHERIARDGYPPFANSHAVMWEITDESRSTCPGASGELDGLFLPDRHPFILCVPGFLFGQSRYLGQVTLSGRHLFAIDPKGGLWETPSPTEPRPRPRPHKRK